MIRSLSNFDTHHITRSHRARKPFAFAVKSTDNLSYFENAAGYLHTFSCSEDGRVWMEKILIARVSLLPLFFLIVPDADALGRHMSSIKSDKCFSTPRPLEVMPLVLLPALRQPHGNPLPSERPSSLFPRLTTFKLT